MQSSPLTVVRMPERFISDDTRVITRPFMPGDRGRIKQIIDRVLRLSEEEAHAVLGSEGHVVEVDQGRLPPGEHALNEG